MYATCALITVKHNSAAVMIAWLHAAYNAFLLANSAVSFQVFGAYEEKPKQEWLERILTCLKCHRPLGSIREPQ